MGTDYTVFHFLWLLHKTTLIRRNLLTFQQLFSAALYVTRIEYIMQERSNVTRYKLNVGNIITATEQNNLQPK